MKKLALLLSTILVLSTACVLFVGCNNGDAVDTSAYQITANMEKMQTNIVGADALAIVSADQLTNTATQTTRSVRRAPDKDNNGNHHGNGNGLALGKVDKDGNVTEVKIEDDQNGYTLTAGDLNAEIYKMKVVGDFTIVAYISSEIRKNLKSEATEYYTENYIGDTENPVMYMYSTFSTVSTVNGNIVSGCLPYEFYYSEEIDKQFKGFSCVGDRILYDRTYAVPADFDYSGYYKLYAVLCDKQQNWKNVQLC